MDRGRLRGPRANMHTNRSTPGLFASTVLWAWILALQRELFSEALDELEVNGDLTNQILEVTLEENEVGIQIVRYSHPLPPDEPASH